jgi:site-specific DNA-methyltransferase (adenine-specific)
MTPTGKPSRQAKRSRSRATSKSGARLLEGDCLEVLGELEPESVDAIVTDPPYGIGFQNERWDSAALQEAAARAGRDRLTPNEAFEAWSRIWAEGCRRVLKPGGFLAAFGSPRTFHRLACGVEDAGLEIRDTLMWLYAEGMSKSRHYPGGRATTLKPAFEPIVLARRGLDGTTEETIARHGTGALMSESCRVEGRHPPTSSSATTPIARRGTARQVAPPPRLTAASARAARAWRPAGFSTARRRAAPSGMRAASVCLAERSISSRTPARAATRATSTRR